MKKELVSVIMPAYNAEKYIGEAIESILWQTYSHFELIVVDDGSMDSTVDVVRSFDDSRIRLISLEKNEGIVGALNVGLSEAKGEFIARMDADDVSVPNRLEIQLNFICSNPSVDICSAQIRLFGSEAGVWRMPLTHEEIVSNLFFGSSIAHAAVFFRRKLIDEGLYHYLGDYPHQEDTYLWHRIKKKVIFANIDEILYDYRIENHNVTQVNRGDKLDRYRKMMAFVVKELQLNPTPKELDIQVFLSSPSLIETVTFTVSEVFDWINKVVQANNKEQVYPIDAFKTVIDLKLKRLFYYLTDRKTSFAFQYWKKCGKVSRSELRYFLSRLVK